MITPERVTVRWGTRDFLNIDYNGNEIGHVRFDNDGEVRPWANHLDDLPVVDLIARCCRLARNAPRG